MESKYLWNSLLLLSYPPSSELQCQSVLILADLSFDGNAGKIEGDAEMMF
jgi:hypothetical protein